MACNCTRDYSNVGIRRTRRSAHRNQHLHGRERGQRCKVGDSFSLTTASGTLAYRVTAVAHYSKGALSSSHVWDAAPARLVLITCDFSDPWGTNTVITAEPN